jgi:hypothetical protein
MLSHRQVRQRPIDQAMTRPFSSPFHLRQLNADRLPHHANALAANPNDLDLALEVARAAIRDGRRRRPTPLWPGAGDIAPWWATRTRQ